MTNVRYSEEIKKVVTEISNTTTAIDEEQVHALVAEILKAEKVFFVGVGRVLLSLQAITKRLAHLGIETHYVGSITEPAITDKDLLIVGSGSGESLFPVAIAKKAKVNNARVAHIGANPKCSMAEYSDVFVKIPVATKFSNPDEIKSVQPMTSLFEQSLLVLGDTIALMIVEEKGLDLHSLWQHHANLE